MASKPKQRESMVTRFKSAQQRRLCHIDGEMSLTKPLTSPERSRRMEISKKSPKSRGGKSPKSSSIKLGAANSKPDTKVTIDEYYPNKLKRQAFAKKIVLKPKHNMKIVAKTSKRKLSTPHKGPESALPSPQETPPSPSPELSVVDVIRIFEETQELDDDDLMEILTCPSPVWWEDPPDSTYIEDPISRRDTPEKTTDNQKIKNERKIQNQTDLDINIQNKDLTFKKKRSKLEELLNNLRVKGNYEELARKNIDDFVNKDVNNTDCSEACSNSEKDNIAQTKNKITPAIKKGRRKTVLKYKNKKRKVIKNSKVKVRHKSKIAENNKMKRSLEKVDINDIHVSTIKIRTPNDINKEVEAKLADNNSGDTDKDDIAINEKSPKSETKEDRIMVEEEDGKLDKADLKNTTVKNVEGSIHSDNTDLSEISVNEEFLKELENINIPIEQQSYSEDMESVKTINELNKSAEPSSKRTKRNIIRKKKYNDTIYYDKRIKIIRNKEKNIKKNTNKVDDERITTTKTTDATEENHDIPTTSTVTDIAEKNNENYLINQYDSQESVDSFEFDLEFENAILGLENTVMAAAKAKKRINKKALNKKKGAMKTPKIIFGDNNEETKESPPYFVKIEDKTAVERGKRKKENEEDKNGINDSNPTRSNTKVRKIEDVSQRGRIRRKKALIGYETTDDKVSDDKNESVNDSRLTDKLEDTSPKPVKEKQPKCPTKNNINKKRKSNNPNTEINPKNISKHGRLRRKKNPFEYDNNDKDTPKTTNIKTTDVKPVDSESVIKEIKTPFTNHRHFVIEDKSPTIETIMNKILKSDVTIKRYANNKIKKDKTESPIKSETDTSKNTHETVSSQINKILSENEELRKANKKETLLSAFVKFVDYRQTEADSISDTGVTFIDEVSNTNASKEVTTNKNKLVKDEPDLKNKDSIDQQNAKNNSEQIVFNMESKKVVTVQSDKESLDNLDDCETITVFKIIPKELE